METPGLQIETNTNSNSKETPESRKKRKLNSLYEEVGDLFEGFYDNDIGYEEVNKVVQKRIVFDKIWDIIQEAREKGHVSDEDINDVLKKFLR